MPGFGDSLDRAMIKSAKLSENLAKRKKPFKRKALGKTMHEIRFGSMHGGPLTGLEPLIHREQKRVADLRAKREKGK